MYSKRQEPTVTTPIESHGHQLLAITGAIAGPALLCVLLRLYVRIGMLKMMGADDYVMCISGLCVVGVFGCFVYEVHNGIGRHLTDPFVVAHFSQIEESFFWHSLFVTTGISCVKISAGLFLLRLVSRTRYQKIILGIIVFLVIFTIACLGTIIFQCLPVQAAWDFSLRPGPPSFGTAKCFSHNTFRSIGLFNGAINIATDFIFAILPIPIVSKLNLNTRTKVTLIGIMSLGFFACAAAIVKEVLLGRFFTTPDFTFNDTYMVWNFVELTVGVIAACLPVLRPLFAFLLENATAAITGSGSRSRTFGNSYAPGYGAGSRKNYVLQSDSGNGNESGIKMSSVTRSTLGGEDKYGAGGVSIAIVGLGVKEDQVQEKRASMPRSRLERSIVDAGSSSEDILPYHHQTPMATYDLGLGGENERPPQRGIQNQRSRSLKGRDGGILKTTEVHVS